MSKISDLLKYEKTFWTLVELYASGPKNFFMNLKANKLRNKIESPYKFLFRF